MQFPVDFESFCYALVYFIFRPPQVLVYTMLSGAKTAALFISVLCKSTIGVFTKYNNIIVASAAIEEECNRDPGEAS